MPDTERTEAELLTIFADSQPPGSINPQDVRDFVVSANLGFKYASTATNLLTSGQNVIGVTDTTVARTITISTSDIINTETIGENITIKDESGGAGTFNILIDTEGSETIDGLTDISIEVDFGNITIYSNGTNLFTVA